MLRPFNDSLGWRQIVGVGMLGGIGFTMSLFIANLAFGEIPAFETAKVGILTALVISGVAGTFVFLIRTKHRGASLPQT
jgi:Na+:H+ antiporter, NhaA family